MKKKPSKTKTVEPKQKDIIPKDCIVIQCPEPPIGVTDTKENISRTEEKYLSLKLIFGQLFESIAPMRLLDDDSAGDLKYLIDEFIENALYGYESFEEFNEDFFDLEDGY
ncbi:MAG: hypothetical protein HW421_1424 [Ignavibacteria bacterium]|nr:hypothetical protein [Ignavibacteria bacterium]